MREEGHRLGPYRSHGRYQVHALLMVPVLFGAFLTPSLLNDTFHLGLERLAAIGTAVFGLTCSGR